MDAELAALARTLGELMREQGLTLATAESCTGGWIAKSMTDIPGSSAWLDRGYITYSNAAKREVLGVSVRTLEEHGAVSEATVAQMVGGVLENCPADLAVAVSGIAGPGGGAPDKPVGTVCFAWQRRGEEAVVRSELFTGDRESIRRQTVRLALRQLIAMLETHG